MKKIVLISCLSLKFVFGGCCAVLVLNSPTNCGAVESVLRATLKSIVSTFEDNRNEYIIGPTEKLNERMKQYNELNGKVYEEEQTILNLNNSIAIATKKQEALLAKLAELKGISVKYNKILQKSNLGKNNGDKK